MPRQIIATSFDLNLRLHGDIKRIVNYLASNVEKEDISICYISTASDDSIVQKFIFWLYIRLMYPKWNIWCPDTNQIDDRLLGQDIIFVGGGNTMTMLKRWSEYGISERLRAAYDSGVIISGVSAGLICWFQTGVTDSTRDLTIMPCLGWLKGSCTPHYEKRRSYCDHAIIDGRLEDLYGVCDGQIIHFIDERLYSFF